MSSFPSSCLCTYQLLPACPMSSAIRSKSPLMIISAVSRSHIWRFSFELPASKKPCQFSELVCQLFFLWLLIDMNFFSLLRSVLPPTFLPLPLSLCLSVPPLPSFSSPPIKKKNTCLVQHHFPPFFSSNFLSYFWVGAITRTGMIMDPLCALSVLAPRVMSVYNKTKR